MKNRKRSYLSIVLALIVVFAICFCAIKSSINNKKEFSVERWNIDIWERENMIDDLVERYNLISMNAEDILNLLGTNGLVENSFLTYYVGKSYAGAILFSISFDENNNVRSYGIIVD